MHCTTIICLARRLGQYRMPFCWTAIELAKIVRGIPLSQVTKSITVLLNVIFFILNIVIVIFYEMILSLSSCSYLMSYHGNVFSYVIL